jgi:hypothetical protein
MTMIRSTRLLSLAFVLAACRPTDMVIDGTDVLLLESYPVQVRLLVTGSHPACETLAWDAAVGEAAGRIDVDLRSEPSSEDGCIGRRSFEESIPLGSFETADFEIFLNGERVGAVRLP